MGMSLLEDGIWVDIDTTRPKDEQEQSLAEAMVSTLKLTQGDNAYFYILERVLNPVPDENTNKLWLHVLDVIQTQKENKNDEL